jgi:hypothetical protein
LQGSIILKAPLAAAPVSSRRPRGELMEAAMAFANDWRDVRAAAYLNMIAGAGILGASLASLSLFQSPRTGGYLITLATLTILMAVFTWRQERSTA